VEQRTRILDIGTGTGVIAIMLAQRNADAQIHAVEIDQDAFEQARQNMKDSIWSDRLEVFHESIQDYARFSKVSYDLIVSNPPFFTGGTFSLDENRNNVRHTVKLPTGDLLAATRGLLSKEGKLCVILPYIEGLRFKERAQQYNLYCSRMTEVISRVGKPVERVLLEFERQECEMKSDQLIIQVGERHEYSDEYMALTKEFYLGL